MKEELVEKWLETEFVNPSTVKVYRSALKRYREEILEGLSFKEAVEGYKRGSRDLLGDMKLFMKSFKDKPTATKNVYLQGVRMFFGEQGLPISKEEWRKAKRRLKGKGTYTVDKAPTRNELKTITSYMDLKGRGLSLFLASSGARIGETLQLIDEDLDLDADPPRATIRKEYTKFGTGGRTVFMSYEARDLMKDWLKVKDGVKKRNGRGDYGGPRVWNMMPQNAREMWNRAIDKAGLNERDRSTKRRIFHLHSLRKFFRSNLGLPWDLTQGIMGHLAYLDKAYQRIGEAKLAEMYRTHMPNVSIYMATTSRKAEVKRFVAMSGTSIPELIKTLNEMMLAGGEGTGGGMSRKLPIDEDYILGLDDEEIGKLIRATLKRETLPNGGRPQQKVIDQASVEGYLNQGWRYVGSLNGNKVIVER